MNHSNIVKFLELVGTLKHEKRTGWAYCGIKDCESISAHMYRMAMMTFLLNDQNNPTSIDRLRCLQLALVHDLAECIVGDLTPLCGVTREAKHKMEDDAMKKIVELTGLAGDELYKLYKEYEAQVTPEAHFTKDLDMYDMILQAFEYEKRENKPGSLQEFFNSTEGKFKHPFIKELVVELHKQRKAHGAQTDIITNGKHNGDL